MSGFLESNKHSVFRMEYHLVMVVKYRRPVIDNAISDRLREMFNRIGCVYGISVVEWNHDVDHVHVLFRSLPWSDFSKFINAYKSASSRRIKREFPHIRKFLWKNAFWSKSYCLLTTGGAPVEIIREYIRTQGEKHVSND